ncbi:uncharacterized protein Tco025E_09897, partial [Trypanosoma conorhini]
MLCRNLLRREGAEHTRRPPTRKEEEEEGRRRSARHDANTQGAQHVNSARGRYATQLRPHGAQPAKAAADERRVRFVQSSWRTPLHFRAPFSRGHTCPSRDKRGESGGTVPAGRAAASATLRPPRRPVSPTQTQASFFSSIFGPHAIHASPSAFCFSPRPPVPLSVSLPGSGFSAAPSALLSSPGRPPQRAPACIKGE